MTYGEQLETDEWKEKRAVIQNRDGHRCCKCQNTTYIDTCKIGVIQDIRFNSYTKRIGGSILEKNNEFLNCEWYVFDQFFNSKPDWENHVCLFTEYKLICQIQCVLGVKHIGGIFDLSKNQFIGDGFDITRDELKVNPQLHPWIYVRNLHVHHNYYQDSLKAWEYPDISLTTLCWSCHESIHQNQKIEIRDALGKFIGTKAACYRCHGAGWFPEYKHLKGGVCFRCKGEKFEP
jgi:hypothetical protein